MVFGMFVLMLCSFSILHGPTPDEYVLMKTWIRNLTAFVNDEEGYSYGTKDIQDLKVVTPERTVEVHADARWLELLKLADRFSGN